MPTPSVVELTADMRRGCLWSGSITLSGTPNTPTTILVPLDAKGFRIYPGSAICRFNVNAAPTAVTDVATADQHAVASDEYEGAWAMPASWTTRLLEAYDASNLTRLVYVMSATASATLYFEFF